jgi:hypothetical protein
MMKLPSLDRNDKQFFIAAILVPIIMWWVFTGRQKYGTKGMR